MGVMEGLVFPSFLKDHFQLNDFTPFHDEIRKINQDLLIGKYVTDVPSALTQLLGNSSLGVFHSEAAGKFGFYYRLSRAARKQFPENTLLSPFLNVQLPDGVGMTFDEEMAGWYFPGSATPASGRDGDLTIASRIPKAGTPAGAVACKFKVRMTVRDLNEFVDGLEHESQMKGTITFDQFEGSGPASFTIDDQKSRFNYLRISPATAEAEMRYRIEFAATNGRRFVFEGTKYMQRDQPGPVQSIAEILEDYTTLYCHVREQRAASATQEIGIAYMKFRTFEDLAAVGNLTGFLSSFQVTGTDDPLIQLQARMRFLAFTGQFVQSEYDPLAPMVNVPDNVRAARRGSNT
jgi:hypothetical protein